MGVYLRWLDKHERQHAENSPLGLILCSEKNHERIEVLELNRGEICVAEYLIVVRRDLLPGPSHDLLRRISQIHDL